MNKILVFLFLLSFSVYAQSNDTLTTSSGLKYIILKSGKGKKSEPGKVAEVHYTGWLLDGKKFDSCLDSGRYVEQVQNDQKEGKRAGVTGTPAIFVNGTLVDGGSVPFPVLERVIDRELARAQAGS